MWWSVLCYGVSFETSREEKKKTRLSVFLQQKHPFSKSNQSAFNRLRLFHLSSVYLPVKDPPIGHPQLEPYFARFLLWNSTDPYRVVSRSAASSTVNLSLMTWTPVRILSSMHSLHKRQPACTLTLTPLETPFGLELFNVTHLILSYNPTVEDLWLDQLHISV